ncbi:2-hydroxychromene-2-carboxylate isomerase [Pseudoxanthomonas winnipegensis]|uniref:2-hydroxychromene-2-carboxylate isomerase n=1 Tax=Pseudoxanthomonas winnipegensis TaxID=2480810 RepID=A0A4Q8M3Q8_9GAMM|nr:2-hydroxychromene-2-carboxylate isomerase [Pseudoxanthomonas winnipegensis]TAA39699.1 2-hydroxychromene-2-carboxylate isomerase [Pseudoxanthomonas winnipegensis]
MAEQLDYFVTLLSPWSYLGHRAFLDMAARHGAVVRTRPVRIFDLFGEVGALPLAQRPPVRQAYRLIELQRVREQRGLPLNLRPKFYPCDIALADRTVIALIAQGHDPQAYMADAFAALWANEQDLADRATLATLLSAHGFDAEALLALADAPQTHATHQDNTRAAIDAGLPGLPGYVRDGEPFWGQDRIDLLDDALRSGRAPYRAG